MDRISTKLFSEYYDHIGISFFEISVFEDLEMIQRCIKDLSGNEFEVLHNVSYDTDKAYTYGGRYSSHRYLHLYLKLYPKTNDENSVIYTAIREYDYDMLSADIHDDTISEIKLYKNTGLIYSVK